MKIHICGIYGSGKSTLASILSKELGLKSYSLDDIKYEIKYNKIKPVEQRIKEVQKICNLNNWITEGAWSNYAEDAFKKADIVIIMNLPKIICAYRIIKRYLSRKKQKNDTFLEALKLIREVYKYHFTKNPVSLHMHKNLIERYNKKYFLVKRKSEIPEVIENVKESLKDDEKTA